MENKFSWLQLSNIFQEAGIITSKVIGNSLKLCMRGENWQWHLIREDHVSKNAWFKIDRFRVWAVQSPKLWPTFSSQVPETGTIANLLTTIPTAQ